MLKPVFPITIIPDNVQFELPDFPTKKFTSASGVEFASLLGCNSVNAKLNLVINNKPVGGCNGCQTGRALDKALVTTLVEFWEEVKGLSFDFLIQNSHPLWKKLKLTESYKRIIESNTWKFSSKPEIREDVTGIYTISIELVSGVYI